MTRPHVRIVAYPKAGDPYTRSFYPALEAAGAEVIAGDFSGRRMLADIAPGTWAHLHWPSFEYFAAERAHWRNLLAAARFAALLLLIRLRGGRLLWTAHNLYPHDGGKILLHRCARWLVTRLSELVVTHGKRAAQLVSEEFGVPTERICSVLCGAWHGEFESHLSRVEARRLLGLPASAWVYAFVGQLKPYKGVDTLLHTFAAIADPDYRLLIAGKFQSARYRDEVMELAACDTRVHLYEGFVADAHLQRYLRACDCAVFPYRSVLTSGNVNLAMSFGCPIIAPAMGAIPDHVPEWAGVLYPATDAEALLRAMHEVRSRQFDPSSIERHAAQLSWQAAAAGLLDRLARMPA